ncbi:trans-sialidase, putative, partial [Trypanosoma cruzi marinkellei]
MLVTLPVYDKTAENEMVNPKCELHLWLTDNTHIVDIGPVSREGENVAASSLLYKSGNNEEKLISLYEKGNEETQSPGMVSIRLTEQLERVRKVLKTWQEVDERVSKLCTPSSAKEDVSPENACGADFNITAGLVGFLSGNLSENTWKDEYLGVNATVKGIVENKRTATAATGPSDGVTFQGAWAEWPVGAQGENQLYHFANYNFTLVATVSLDGVPEGDTHIPLMGVNVTMNEGTNTVLVGLSYNNNEKKWQLLCGDENNKVLSSPLEPDTTDHVVILLRNGNQTSAYVDGQ